MSATGITMKEIRKLSVGLDLKDGCMHYIVGQRVVGDSQTIHNIEHDTDSDSYKIHIINDKNEICLWKEFRNTVPISIEYNINF